MTPATRAQVAMKNVEERIFFVLGFVIVICDCRSRLRIVLMRMEEKFEFECGWTMNE
jgi:hypothetical protein